MINVFNQLSIISFIIYFVFFIVNRSHFLLQFNIWWKNLVFVRVKGRIAWILQKLDYLKECSFCFTFWVTLVLFFYNLIPLYFVFCCPVINLIIDSIVRFSSQHK